jgi:hypothetical protein
MPSVSAASRKALRAAFPQSLHITLHRFRRHVKSARDLGLAHRSIHHQLTGEQPEGGQVFLRMLKHRQMPIQVCRLPLLAIEGRSAVMRVVPAGKMGNCSCGMSQSCAVAACCATIRGHFNFHAARRSMGTRSGVLTLVFDREAYSPEFFAEMKARRIAILSYRKYPGEDWPVEEFVASGVRLASGEEVTMKLAERGTMLSNRLWGARGAQVVRERPANLHFEHQLSSRLHSLGGLHVCPMVPGELLQIHAAALWFGPPRRVRNRTGS